MSVDRFGKTIFLQIRPLFFFILLAAPLLFSFCYLSWRYSELIEKEERLNLACKKQERTSRKRAFLKEALQKYLNPEPYFLDKQIESFQFLQTERQHLSDLLHHPASADRISVKQRLDFIESKENFLGFAEEAMRSDPLIKETEENPLHSVEIDENDLHRLLSLIESIPIGAHEPLPRSPQLIIRDFHLWEKPSQSTFELEIGLIKREFTQP